MPGDICYLSVRSLNQLFRQRALSPVEVIGAVFDRIDRYNGVLNAFCVLDKEAALKAAHESENRWMHGKPLGLLDGVPVTVKDLSLTSGWPTRRGSLAISPDQNWSEDAPCVARIREEGAVLFGKTTVPEFGAGVGQSKLCGITRNPYDPTKTPGGSSSGAAVSLAAGMGTIALASDAGGSIRTPSSFTGVFGFKPTFGVVPDYPPSYLGSVAVIGPMTRCVEDCALTMNVITRPDIRDPYAVPSQLDGFHDLDRDIEGMSIAFSPTLGYAKVDLEVETIVANAVSVLKEQGAHVDIVEQVFPDPAEIVSVIMAAGMANAFQQFGFSQEQLELVNPGLLNIVRAGKQLAATDYLAAQRERERLAIRMQEFHIKYPILVTPTTPIPAFGVELEGPADPRYPRPSDWKPFTAAFNLTLQPAASVPCGLTKGGLPVGIQVVGPRFSDLHVLRVCRAIERMYPFRKPDLRAVQNFLSGYEGHAKEEIV